MKKILAAVLAAATFASTLSFGVAAGAVDSSEIFKINGSFPVQVYAGNATVGKDDVAQPGTSMFIQIPDQYADKDEYTVKVKAEEGAKYIKKISTYVGKNSPTGWKSIYREYNNEAVAVTDRHQYIEVALKPNYTDAENKIRLEITVSSKGETTATKASMTTRALYIGNATDTGSQDYLAGHKGVVVKPVANEDNEIIWSDDNRDLARLSFFADSDTAKAYPKLNTKWTEADYADYFQMQDAYLFEFVSNPYISSTSRATLEIYNPYYDIENDNMTVAPEDVIIYQVTADGLVDVTDQFKFGENEDGDNVFTIKTRQLGTYIFAEAEATVDADDDEEIVAPVEGDKKPVDTGR